MAVSGQEGQGDTHGENRGTREKVEGKKLRRVVGWVGDMGWAGTKERTDKGERKEGKDTRERKQGKKKPQV